MPNSDDVNRQIEQAAREAAEVESQKTEEERFQEESARAATLSKYVSNMAKAQSKTRARLRYQRYKG